MAQIHQIEVVIHVDEALSEAQRGNLIDHLQKLDGVETARFTDGRDHLMLIDYDADKLKTFDVLDYVKQEHMHAEVVGL